MSPAEKRTVAKLLSSFFFACSSSGVGCGLAAFRYGKGRRLPLIINQTKNSTSTQDVP